MGVIETKVENEVHNTSSNCTQGKGRGNDVLCPDRLDLQRIAFSLARCSSSLAPMTFRK
jgi:hypothetical protein